jgi:hypothetical protein
VRIHPVLVPESVKNQVQNIELTNQLFCGCGGQVARMDVYKVASRKQEPRETDSVPVALKLTAKVLVRAKLSEQARGLWLPI